MSVRVYVPDQKTEPPYDGEMEMLSTLLSSWKPRSPAAREAKSAVLETNGDTMNPVSIMFEIIR